MHFKIAKSAQSYFNNIMNLEGSHAAEDKNKGNTAQKSRRDTARSDIIRPWINR